LLIRRALVEAVGHFDEQFFAYWEDVDYSLRSIRAGYHNIVVSEDEVRHAPGIHETGLSAKPPHFFYYMARNELLLTRKHVGWWAGRRPLWWAIRRALGRTSELNDYPAAIDAIFYGLFDGLTFRRGAFDPARRLPRPVRRLLLAANRALFGAH